jgi:hypothetical protein
MQKIKYWIVLSRMLGCRGVVARGKIDAIMDRMFQYPAV